MASGTNRTAAAVRIRSNCATARPNPTRHPSSKPQPPQVKVAEHILTGHKVAIKILNRRKIQAMDMEEKGERAPGWQEAPLLMRMRRPGRGST